MRTLVFAAAVGLCALPAAADDLIVLNGESIQDAIASAASFETVLVEPGAYEESLLIDTYQGLTIKPTVPGGRVELLGDKGDGTVVRFEGNYDAGTTLEGFDIVGPDAEEYAVTVGGNSAPTMVDCTVTGIGGGVHVRGGGNGIGLTAIGCTFSGLSAPYGFGGALNADQRADIALYACAFEDNAAPSAGGAVYLRGIENRVVILDCRFERNRAGIGGAIMQAGNSSGAGPAPTTAHIAGSEFIDNSTDLGAVFEDGNGGAIHWRGTQLTLSACTFIANTCHPNGSGTGGGLYVSGGLGHLPRTILVDRCVFTGNRASFGGAVGTPHRPLLITNSLFIANTATQRASAVVGGDNTDTGTGIAHCTFVANDVLGADGDGDNTIQLADERDAVTGCLFVDSGPFPIEQFESMVRFNLFDDPDAAGLNDDPTNAYAEDIGFVSYDPGSPETGDYRLTPVSLAIDFVPPAYLPPDLPDQDRDFITFEPIPQDLDGMPRFSALAPDAGAYEFPAGPPVCLADLTGDGALTIDDIDAFVIAFLGGSLDADLDANGALNLDDVEVFVAAFLAGCP